jgi:hypothetical protein
MQIDEKVELEFLASIVQGQSIVEPDVLKRIEPGHFTVGAYQWMVDVLKKRDWRPVAAGYLDQELTTITDQQKSYQYKSQLSRLYTTELTFKEDASSKFREYVAYCVANASVRAAFKNFGNSSRVDFLLDDLGKGVSEARDVVELDALNLVDYTARYKNRMEVRKQFRDNPSLNPRLLTGIPGLDEQFKIKAPMVVDFMAPFKRYKSIFLNAMGFAGTLQGMNVLHVTYENSVDLTEDRYDSMFSGLNYERISNMLITEEERDWLDRMFTWMNSWDNRLKIVKGVPHSTKVKDVEDKLLKYKEREGWVPDVEVWDYLNLINPSINFREERLRQGQAVWDLKNHADLFQVPIIEASQANMEGVKSDRLDMSHRGKSIDISQGINLSIAIDQTEKEKAEGIVVLSPLMSRESEIRIPEIILDADIARMQISRSMYKLWEHAAKIHPHS